MAAPWLFGIGEGYATTMPRRPSATRRWLTAATWPVGVALTSWDYMWRITPMRREEASIAALFKNLGRLLLA